MGNNNGCDIESKINSLQNQLYGNVYKTTLPDKLLFFLPQHKHKLTSIRSYMVRDPNGNEIEVGFKLLPDKSVEITANSSLQGCTLILF